MIKKVKSWDEGEKYPDTRSWSEDKREEYLAANEGLIYSIVKSIQSIPDPALSPEDLCQEARIAFWRAFDGYDPDRGTRFSTYVHKSIRNAVNEVLRSANAGKRKPPCTPIPYDSGRGDYGDDILGADNMDVAEGSLARQVPPIDEWCAHREMVECVHRLLRTKFTAEERFVFLNLSLGYSTQVEIARHLGCSQARVSMIYTFVKLGLHYELKAAGFSF